MVSKKAIISYITILIVGISLPFFINSCGSNGKANWAVGTWEGSINANGSEHFVIRIKKDGTCKVNLTSPLWEADFEGEWEQVAENEIKIFDYVGHYQHNKQVSSYSGNVSKWSTYLQKDGKFFDNSKRPVGYLHKR